MFTNFPVNGNSLGPSRWGVSSPHDVPWKKFDACKEATHAPHVVIPISLHLVVKVAEDQHLVVKRLKGFEDGFVFKVIPHRFRPKLIGNRSIWAKHHDQPLLGRGSRGFFGKKVG